MKEIWVRSLVQDPTYHGATKPQEPGLLSPATEDLQQEKPPQSEAHTPQRRVAPALHS